jgi:hypothetical protein
MDNDVTMRRIVRSETREERELLREYAYLNKLKRYVRERNKTAAAKIVNRIQRYEDRLERVHQRVLDNLEDLRRDNLPENGLERIQGIEVDVGYFMEDFRTMASRDEARLKEMVEDEMWEDLERYAIRCLKRDITRWLEIDRTLIDLEVDVLSE